jgi:hypothetical protein
MAGFVRFTRVAGFTMSGAMNEPNPQPEEPPRRYTWPWFFWGAVVLFVLLAVIWMTVEVKKLERERDYNAPLPASGAVH